MKRIFYAVEKSLPPTVIIINCPFRAAASSTNKKNQIQIITNSEPHLPLDTSSPQQQQKREKNRKSFMHRISSFIIADIGSLVVVPSTNRSLTSLRRVSTVRAISRHRKCTRCAWANEATNGPSSMKHKKIASWKNSAQLKHWVFRWNYVVKLTNGESSNVSIFSVFRTNRINHH